MSGQLVGEVIAAGEALQRRGLPPRAFHALMAIAEKCHAGSRQGSVPWSHIRAGLYGASKRTAERAVQDLKTAGVVRVIKPGFNNNHGRSCAPLYEIAALTDTDTTVTASPQTDTDKSGDRYRQNDDRYRHPGVVLNGSTNGSTNGGSAGDAAHPPQPPPHPGLEAEEPEPPQTCPQHPNGTDRPCRPCGTARNAHDAWKELQDAQAAKARAAIRAAIDACGDCDQAGRRDDQTDCPKHPNFRQKNAA